MDKLSVGGSTTHSQHCGSMNGGSVLVQLSVRVIAKSTFNVDETKDGLSPELEQIGMVRGANLIFG